MPINVTDQALGGTMELWYFEDESDLSSRTNITECAAGLTLTHSLTSGLPCWNNTDNRTVDIYVPHFSSIVFANNTDAPTVNVTTPNVDTANFNQSVSSFVSNITVSADAVKCIYYLNATKAAENNTASAMTKSGNICLGSTENLLNGEYNITFNVTDSSGNINSYLLPYNMTDITIPNNGDITSSTGETSADVIITGTNESVNATVAYQSTGNESFTTTTDTATQTDFNVTQTVTISSLTASTTYYYNVTVCDFNGNCKVNDTVFSFKTSAAAATTTTTTTTTTGGGGGGAAAVSKVADSKAQVWQSVPAGSSVSLNIDKETIAVTSVSVIDFKAELKNVELEVEALTENPLTTEATAKVYQYFRVNKKNIVETDAESLTISFRVPKSWLSDNGLASGDISLFRFRNGWNELTTSVTGTDSIYVNYEADTPGFSSFAIGTKSGIVVEEEVPEEAEEVPEEEVAPPEAVEVPKVIEAPSKAPVAWIIAAIVIILGIILIVVYQKKKQQV